MRLIIERVIAVVSISLCVGALLILAIYPAVVDISKQYTRSFFRYILRLFEP